MGDPNRDTMLDEPYHHGDDTGDCSGSNVKKLEIFRLREFG